tara:strand:+ start:92 stop:343 length:252 start_codon:yes stop_codon:yes gene_type:complete
MKIFVGNLPYSADENSLSDLFGQYGTITDTRLIKDRETGRSKGFAFITFDSKESMTAALEQNGQDFGGRALRVNEAEDRRPNR